MGMLVAKWNLFHKCVLTFLALASPLCGLWQKGFLSCYNQLCLRSPPLQCYLHQDPQLSLMLQKFITIIFVHRLLSFSFVWLFDLPSEVRSFAIISEVKIQKLKKT